MKTFLQFVTLCMAFALSVFVLTSSTQYYVDFQRNLAVIAGVPVEERIEQAYASYGYGYVKEILRHMPAESSRFPVVRYNDYSKDTALLFDKYYVGLDPNILIGIGLDPDSTRERRISAAKQVTALANSGDDNDATEWMFTTTDDYDLMTAFTLYFDTIPHPSTSLKIQLFDSTKRHKLLGEWDLSSLPQSAGPHRCTLPTPLVNFSFGRGATAFDLLISSAGGGDAHAPVFRVDIYGTKVDLSAYKVVNRNGKNLTAVTQRLLSETQQGHSPEWATFLQAVTNVN